MSSFNREICPDDSLSCAGDRYRGRRHPGRDLERDILAGEYSDEEPCYPPNHSYPTGYGQPHVRGEKMQESWAKGPHYGQGHPDGAYRNHDDRCFIDAYGKCTTHNTFDPSLNPPPPYNMKGPMHPNPHPMGPPPMVPPPMAPPHMGANPMGPPPMSPGYMGCPPMAAPRMAAPYAAAPPMGMHSMGIPPMNMPQMNMPPMSAPNMRPSPACPPRHPAPSKEPRHTNAPPKRPAAPAGGVPPRCPTPPNCREHSHSQRPRRSHRADPHERSDHAERYDREERPHRRSRRPRTSDNQVPEVEEPASPSTAELTERMPLLEWQDDAGDNETVKRASATHRTPQPHTIFSDPTLSPPPTAAQFEARYGRPAPYTGQA